MKSRNYYVWNKREKNSIDFLDNRNKNKEILGKFLYEYIKQIRGKLKNSLKI